MGYPYGPQQGHDPYAGGYAQPGYAADPYAQQGYAPQPYGYAQQPAPGYGYGAPAYGAPQRAGGGTGITAALLSLLISLFALIGLGVVAATELNTDSVRSDDARAGTIAGIAIAAVPALLWLLGSILLFRRKTAGRVILIILSTIGLLISAISVAIAASEGAPPAVVIGSVVATCIPLLILLCAAAPSTGRWIRAARQPAYAPYPYY
ncbi:hypothetical protein [Nocardia sp. NPDC050718]|uniref:hypothetical protein n=1 Tax=Nocardia sp. NPDC050718 TaxID=3155788 RepID=UPI0033D218B3